MPDHMMKEDHEVRISYRVLGVIFRKINMQSKFEEFLRLDFYHAFKNNFKFDENKLTQIQDFMPLID